MVLEVLEPALGEKQKEMLFPLLNVWDSKLLDLEIDEVKKIPYPELLRGNRNRRYHAELSHDLHDNKELDSTNLDELAYLRCQLT